MLEYNALLRSECTEAYICDDAPMHKWFKFGVLDWMLSSRSDSAILWLGVGART